VKKFGSLPLECRKAARTFAARFIVNQSVKFSTGAYRNFRIEHLTVARKPFKERNALSIRTTNL
jgi:hypothetical protein